MLQIIEKLLELQDCDRQIIRNRQRIDRIASDRTALESQESDSLSELSEARKNAHAIESQRKELELETDSQQELIQKYSQQQLQTKKNQEYRALANEIVQCRKAISDLEDRQLELMERFDGAQETIESAKQKAEYANKLATEKIRQLAEQDTELRSEVDRLQAEREQLAQRLEDPVRQQYERLLKSKGGDGIVDVGQGVCGGCHVKLPVQIVITCKGQKEIVHCPNCGRIVYYDDKRPALVAD